MNSVAQDNFTLLAKRLHLFGRMLNETKLLVLVLLLRRVPGALKCGPRERQHVCGISLEGSECGRRTTKGSSPESREIRASLQPVFWCLRLLVAQRAREKCVHRGRSMPVGRGIGDGASDEGFRGGK